MPCRSGALSGRRSVLLKENKITKMKIHLIVTIVFLAVTACYSPSSEETSPHEQPGGEPEGRQHAEDGRVAVRNVRRDVMADMRELKKEGEVGEDDERRGEEALQKETDAAIAEIDSLLKSKEEEILEV